MSNIASEAQVKRAEQREKDLRRRELNDLRTVLSNVSGRRFVWRILEKCHVFGSVFSADQSIMAHQSGQQDLGHFLMAEVIEADENLMIKLMKDNQKKES